MALTSHVVNLPYHSFGAIPKRCVIGIAKAVPPVFLYLPELDELITLVRAEQEIRSYFLSEYQGVLGSHLPL